MATTRAGIVGATALLGAVLGCDRPVDFSIVSTSRSEPRERVIELREYVGRCPTGTFVRCDPPPDGVDASPSDIRARPFTPDDPEVLALGAPRSVQFIDVAMPMSRPLGPVRERRALVAFGRDSACQVVASACAEFDPERPAPVTLCMLLHDVPGPACAVCAQGVCD
ncbi:MAG: hypothetical protein K1X94_23990 [Sandaracinaceae bacterium]|nr:hypothetical protein [Sandaracinaceae bacterium]